MQKFNKGDFVMYDDRELGRVATVRDDGAIFVCYSTGCTAANTPKEKLRLATEKEMKKAGAMVKLIGFNRFNPTCPDYDSYTCKSLCPDKTESY